MFPTSEEITVDVLTYHDKYHGETRTSSIKGVFKKKMMIDPTMFGQISLAFSSTF